jgi:hypothetical protein
VNVHALLARSFKLFEYLLRFIDTPRVDLQFHPALARSDIHAKGVLEVLQKFNVIGVKRLQSAWAFKLQRASFSHFLSGIGICADRLAGSQCH